ncbi:DoxX family protein [Dyadobacter sp. CY261]|uniref:DoxX family membrane protein n=1 Tax=Dyadobacter sp. CY261 TaxID=2907203 RepID=UPI001F307522|nr:DoxX family protein [Dyadobacter sp. CY261]MCF0069459.1 DoxX family protein [Dyadobacter sp. CY261]
MMKISVKTGHVFYGVAMIVYGVQQFLYGDFRAVQVPAWQSKLPFLPFWAYVTGAGLILAGLGIIAGKKVREIALVLGYSFLLLLFLVHVPFQIFAEPYNLHLAVWTNALKDLALAGGALVIAGTFPQEKHIAQPDFTRKLTRIIPFGPMLFSITMTSFGIDHFLYAERLSDIVPAYLPDRVFWMYFTGVVLIGAGFAITMNIRRGVIALLFSITLALWILLLHIPRAIADPFGSRSNEISSVFDALAFCGTALMISLPSLKKDLHEMFGIRQ